jgi:undecaprenyl-diphosphatase
MFQRLSARVKKFWAALAILSVEMTIILVLFILAMIVFIYTTRRVIFLDKTKLDNKVFAYIHQHVSARNNDIMLFFTFLGTHEFLIPANLLLIAYFAFIKKNKWLSIKIPAIALSSLILMFALKHLFNRHRPETPLLEAAKGLSFPSGHALFSVTFYGLLVYIVFKTIKNKELKWTLITMLLLLILIIGFSRIYLRVHYPSDVAAGYCIGFMWLVFTIWLLNRIEQSAKAKLNEAMTSSKPPAPKGEGGARGYIQRS